MTSPLFRCFFVFGSGVLIGIFCSFKRINYLPKCHRSATVSVIIGLMAGSLFAVVIGATTLDEPLSPLSLRNADIGLFLAGIMFVA